MSNGNLEHLRALFSDYRAEWSADLFSNLFIVPPYFKKLEVPRPCILIGGRGTGKTTSLRSLRFDASEARRKSEGVSPRDINYWGIYVRMNKNRVRAFQGAGLSVDQWNRAFAHYFNLLCVSELCSLVRWLGREREPVSPNLQEVGRSLGIEATASADSLEKSVRTALVGLELYVNNPTRAQAPLFSMPEAPIAEFVRALCGSPGFEGKLIFCCIDEYENLLDSQQAIINGYIKHAGLPLSYKVGVKRNGLRSRDTVDAGDPLSTPADYAEIDISVEGFEGFAARVAEHRLSLGVQQGLTLAQSLDEFMPELPMSIEADLLGCDKPAREVLAAVESSGTSELIEWARGVPASQLYFVKYWAESEGTSIVELARDWMVRPDAWLTRFGNYSYASLFWLSKGRKGSRIRKYYAGARTHLMLASGNIRYFIELIDESLNCVLASPEGSSRWTGVVEAKFQSEAARVVGKRRLDQVEGLSERGTEIKRLALAVGKVFFELARDPIGKSPEVNSFVLSGSAAARDEVLSLLHEGVSQLAFEVEPRTKATTQSEIRDDEFRLHPIFAPFFEYSHRKKRRTTFSADLLREVQTSPAQAINRLLQRPQVSVDELPRQLALFTEFFDNGSVGNDP
ncbi:MAG: hypothetical protein JNN27_13260 [Planctomycetes bacterium]|nr:hypothetical protein [Planctomycetota bacterium]